MTDILIQEYQSEIKELGRSMPDDLFRSMTTEERVKFKVTINTLHDNVKSLMAQKVRINLLLLQRQDK